MPVDLRPLVSIALITYNGEKYLRQQLDSLLAQTYRPIEVIACDDGSTDGTLHILEDYRQTHGIKVFRNEKNLGYVKNFERAVSHCSGTYIAPSDQDDIWQPEKIEHLVSGIDGYDLVCSDAVLIDENGATVSASAMDYSRFAPMSGTPFTRLLYSPYVIGCTSLFTRHLVLRALPIPEGEKYHDWWFSLMASTMKGIHFIPRSLLQYRQHGDNTIGLKKEASFLGRLFGFLYIKADRGFCAMQQQRLSMILRSGRFSAAAQQRDIRNALAFHSDLLKPGIHLRAFRIAVSCHRFIFPWTNGFFRFKAVMGCLFR
jgi:glycosyltransferase involved in cell wall biosynthesis